MKTHTKFFGQTKSQYTQPAFFIKLLEINLNQLHTKHALFQSNASSKNNFSSFLPTCYSTLVNYILL